MVKVSNTKLFALRLDLSVISTLISIAPKNRAAAFLLTYDLPNASALPQPRVFLACISASINIRPLSVTSRPSARLSLATIAPTAIVRSKAMADSCATMDIASSRACPLRLGNCAAAIFRFTEYSFVNLSAKFLNMFHLKSVKALSVPPVLPLRASLFPWLI